MADEHTTPQHLEPASPQPRLSSASIFKIVIPVIVIGFILLLIYTFFSGLRSAQKVVKTAASPTPTPISTTKDVEVTSPLGSNPTSLKALHAGMQNNAFFPYALNVSEGWGDAHDSDASAPRDALQLTKENYTLNIVQESMEGGFCVFSDDDPEDVAGENGQHYKTFVGIPGINAQFRRATNDNKTFVICERKGAQYGYPTSFGQITYSVPVPTDSVILNEMDAMVASLKR